MSEHAQLSSITPNSHCLKARFLHLWSAIMATSLRHGPVSAIMATGSTPRSQSPLFLSDVVAESIGWQASNPFQLEIAFANLVLGVLGMVAVGRRDGFREATVIAVTVFSLGATVVHIMDIAAAGNLAPGNTLQNAINLARAALLIGFLAASRRAESSPDSEAGSAAFARWRVPLLQAPAPVTISS